MLTGGLRRQGLRTPHRVSGVTLLEMLLVLMLMALGGALAAMLLSGGLDGMRLRSEARELAAQLRYTRTQAMVTGKPQRFVIEPRAHRWQAPNGRHGDIPKQLGVTVVSARQQQREAAEAAIVFFQDGGSSGGQIRLSSKRARWHVDVAWLTGEVRAVRGGSTD
ncbi:MAG TPA: GspH/FimT family pseudopilin [Pseudoxanthomonas sp.]|jgi:general secretion pathway protein H|nr:GspH/FimT family pseudopilin [Pseudoxanthomonas sp.]